MKNYDLFIIGGGPAGYVGAIKAAKLGKSVALAERREVGGTCLNRGCIPTKTLIHTADIMHEMTHNAEKLGITAENVGCDTKRLSERRNEVVNQLRNGVAQLLNANGVTVYNCTAKIGKDRLIQLENDEVTADNILIATGSSVSVPPIPGAENDGVVTSDNLLEDDFILPRRLVIIGGGVIGVEFASVYSALGCETTIIEGMPKIISALDDEISRSLAMSLKKRGVTIFADALVGSIEKDGDALKVNFTQKGKVICCEADRVLIATGRKPDTSGLFADGFSVETERGGVCVDENFMTGEKGVYAVGDVVCGSVQLAHAASAQAVNCVCRMFGETPEFNLNTIPACIYTSPEIACTGLTEQQAKQQGIEIKIGKFSTLSNGKSVISLSDRGFIKLVFNAQTDILIGAQLMCERATDMIGELVTAINCGLTQKQLAASVKAHPTYNEAIGEAVEDAAGEAIHVVYRRR